MTSFSNVSKEMCSRLSPMSSCTTAIIPFDKNQLRLLWDNILNHGLDLGKRVDNLGLDAALHTALDVLPTRHVLCIIELLEHPPESSPVRESWAWLKPECWFAGEGSAVQG